MVKIIDVLNSSLFDKVLKMLPLICFVGKAS